MPGDHSEPTELKTARLTLRRWSPADANDVFAYAGDSEFGRFIPVPVPYTRAAAREYVNRQAQSDWSRAAAFAIVQNGHAVGGVDLIVSASDQNGKLGFAIAREHWGKGLVAEAAHAVIEFGFKHYRLHRVYAFADIRNRQSWRVLEKLGMEREGLLRGHLMVRGEPGNAYCYGILRTEWNLAG